MARTCPSCGSPDVARIVYGMPDPSAMEAAERGEVAIGGCCITVSENGDWAMPELRCRECGTDFSRPRRGRPALT